MGCVILLNFGDKMKIKLDFKPIRLPLKNKDERIRKDKQYLVYNKDSKEWNIANPSKQWYGWHFDVGDTTAQDDDFGPGLTYTKMFECSGKYTGNDEDEEEFE